MAGSTLWLVRHGETEWSRSGRHTGKTDLPLTPTGRRQAEALGRRLARRPFAPVLMSPMQRAVETCRLAGYGEVAHISEDLREWDYGAYEGRTTRDIRLERPGWTIWSGGAPEGETALEVATRLERIIARAVGAGGDVAIFGHGHALRVLAARWLGLAPEAGRLFALDTGSISILGYERQEPVMMLWNDARAHDG